MDPIIESEMTFGPYQAGEVFRIENSAAHLAAGEGVKIIEFYKLKSSQDTPPTLWLIEAKKTPPMADPEKFNKSIEKLEKLGSKEFEASAEVFASFINFIKSRGPKLFPLLPSDVDTYFSELREKMSNALTLFFATRFGRHPAQEQEWPEPFRQLQLNIVDVRFFLVIKTATDSWLPPLNEKLKKVMRPVIGTWGLGPTSVEVLTEELARQKGLIVNNAG